MTLRWVTRTTNAFGRDWARRGGRCVGVRCEYLYVYTSQDGEIKASGMHHAGGEIHPVCSTSRQSPDPLRQTSVPMASACVSALINQREVCSL
jgi:hypothetical protein